MMQKTMTRYISKVYMNSTGERRLELERRFNIFCSLFVVRSRYSRQQQQGFSLGNSNIDRLNIDYKYSVTS